MRIRSLQHSVYQHQYHIVWGTKYRRKYLKDYVRGEFAKSLYSAMKKYPTLHLIAMNIDEDHIHIQIEIPPNIPVSKAVQELKIEASKQLKRKFKFIRRMYLDGSIWSVGYFSFTIGLNEEQIKKYIEYQGRQDLSQQVGFEFS
ncbi:MAG: IS200/IS605 family transposase [Proteobacteria bacterium]|nr:IS200/IS605 family transposase [Pseudomonadota bacterium]